MISLVRILFQRGVYPSDDFHMVKKYGQTVLVTQDLALENYLDRCLSFHVDFHIIAYLIFKDIEAAQQ